MKPSATPEVLRVLSLEDVREVYDHLVELHARDALLTPMGAWTRNSDERWSSALYALHPMHGFDANPTLEAKAARLLLGGCVFAHPLGDGNKRLSIFALHEQLMVNGYSLDTDDGAIIEVVQHTIRARQAGTEPERLVEIVADWIAERIVALPARDA